MNTLIALLVLVIVFGMLFYVVRLLPLPEPFNKLAEVLVILVLVLVLLGMLFGVVSVPALRLR